MNTLTQGAGFCNLPGPVMVKSLVMIGLITAVPQEAGLLLEQLRGPRQDGPLLRGLLQGRETACVCSGVGVANAAWAATVLAERLRPRLLVVLGTGGAYPGSGLRPCQVVAAEAEVYADSGAGREGMKALGLALLEKGPRRFFNEFPLSRAPLKLLRKALPQVKTARFATVCASSRGPSRPRRLREAYNVQVENMEGAAVVQVALRYGIQVLELRAISNRAGRAPHRAVLGRAALACQEALLELLKHLP